MADDERFLAWFRRFERASATPNAAAAMLRWSLEIDVRAILPAIQAPTLLIHRRDLALIDCRAARWMAEQIPGARSVELPDTAGDGFLVTFDGPARAIRCATAIRDAVRDLGLEIRAGLHTGEVERRDDSIAGLAVHIGARLLARRPGVRYS